MEIENFEGLRIGDWYHHVMEDKNYRISIMFDRNTLDGTTIALTKIDNSGIQNMLTDNDFMYFTPIRLTEELLLANGFHKILDSSFPLYGINEGNDTILLKKNCLDWTFRLLRDSKEEFQRKITTTNHLKHLVDDLKLGIDLFNYKLYDKQRK